MQKSKSPKKSNILVIAAHPDDEILGCGGSIIKLKKKCNINVLFMTDGVSARKKNQEKIIKRRNSCERLFKKLGIKKNDNLMMHGDSGVIEQLNHNKKLQIFSFFFSNYSNCRPTYGDFDDKENIN